MSPSDGRLVEHAAHGPGHAPGVVLGDEVLIALDAVELRLEIVGDSVVVADLLEPVRHAPDYARRHVEPLRAAPSPSRRPAFGEPII